MRSILLLLSVYLIRNSTRPSTRKYMYLRYPHVGSLSRPIGSIYMTTWEIKRGRRFLAAALFADAHTSDSDLEAAKRHRAKSDASLPAQPPKHRHVDASGTSRRNYGYAFPPMRRPSLAMAEIALSSPSRTSARCMWRKSSCTWRRSNRWGASAQNAQARKWFPPEGVL